MAATAAPRPAFRFHPLLWCAAAGLLLVPAAATLLSPEVNWGVEDFAACGLMLAVLGILLEAAWAWLAAPWWRLGGAMLAVFAFLTVWAQLAVGLFD